MPTNPRDLFTRIVNAMDALDIDEIRKLVHPDFVGDMPQSGERVHGVDQILEQLQNYPRGGTEPAPWETSSATVLGDEERWAISPGYTVVPLSAPNKYTIVQRAQYPDGSWWRVVILAELKDDRLYRAEFFFAPEMPAPLVESIAIAGSP
jgi:hypothetical protein